MYEAFYGLSEPPFRLTPDPHYLYLSTHHREALGHLLFGIREGTGFIAVTGDIGTGKTTLLRALLRDLEANTTVGYIFNPALSDLELLQTVNSEFSLPATSTSKKELVDELNRFLVAQKLAGKRVVVIVDEAQNLPPATLEQLRLLSNLETETTKLLQIVLVGQPELKQLLGRPELAQLNQRITVRWHLEPLDRAETARYIAHRLRIAGGPGTGDIFSPAALRLLYRYSGGVPRLINIAAHRALLAGYTREQRTISGPLARHVIAELRTDDAGPRARRYGLLRVAGAAAAALVVGLVTALVVLRPAADPNRDPILTAAADPTPAADPSPAAPTPAPAVPTESAEAAVGAMAAPSAAAIEPVATPEPAAPEPAPNPTDVPVAEPAALDETGAETDTPAAYQPPSITDGPVAFWAALAAVDHQAAAVAATASLLAAWNVEPLRKDEIGGPRLDLQTIATRRGLRYLPTSGTLSRLAMLNVPAILELSLPDTGQRRFAVLAGIAGSKAVVRFKEMGTLLTPQDIDRVWLGDAHVLWRDFENLSPRVLPGSAGPEVERLQKLLARVGVYPAEPSLTYDTATTEAIARFQRSHRLIPDGIVGPLTKIVLYGAVADYQHPRLSGGT
jgi:general secretion pathway protein A